MYSQNQIKDSLSTSSLQIWFSSFYHKIYYQYIVLFSIYRCKIGTRTIENYLLAIATFCKENWSVMSNRESGDGFSDILIRIEDEDVGIVIEVKYASDGNMEKECENALQQITDVRYTESLEQEGIHKIIKYGIVCYKKKCKVMMKIEL